MLNESHNNFSAWKERLDSLDNPTEERWNKEAAWGQLHQRLYEKRSAKKAFWYVAAAACLLLTFILSWMFTDKKETPLVKNTVRLKQGIQIQTFHPTQILKKNEEENTRRVYVTSKQAKAHSYKMNKTTAAAINNTISNKQILKDLIEPVISPPIVNNVVIADSSRITAKVTYRPKLRVIHINELGLQVNEVKFALNEGMNLPIKITTHNIFSGSLTRPLSDHDILKIKLPPQN